MKIEEKTILWKPVSEYTGGRVLATNGLDILIGELNPEGDCVSEDCSGIHLCGITHLAKIDGFFPELAESEDERIRKAIHIYLDWLDGRNKDCQPKGEYTIRDMIAWLEKQGFQKPTDNEMKEALRTEYEKGRADAIAEMQNLAWSEEDDLILETIIDHIIPDKPFVANGFTDEELVTWLKSLRPQPKKEWSEEDESIALGIEQIVNCASLLNIAPDRLNKVRDLLKSLKSRVQPKQEWNEEDESYLNTTIAYLKDAKEFKKTAENCMDWLKSLKDRVQSRRRHTIFDEII